MNCQHCRNIMFDYFEAELSSSEIEAIELHLQNCEHCRRQFELTKLENQILRDTADIPEINPAFNSQVMGLIQSGAALKQNTAASKKARFGWRPIYSKVTVAAILLLVCFSVPSILPELSGKITPRQTALLENATPLTTGQDIAAKSLDKTKETNDAGNYAQLNDIDNNDKIVVNNGSAISNAKPAPTQLAQPESDNSADQSAMTAATEYKSSMPIYGQTEQPESSRSLKSNTRIAASHAVLPHLYRVPEDFVLQSTKYVNESQIQYSYADANGDKTFSANVTLVAPVADFTAMAGMAADEGQNSLIIKEPKTLEMENLYPFQNLARRTIEYNGLEYQVLITSSMNTEELNQLADEISLVNPTDE